MIFYLLVHQTFLPLAVLLTDLLSDKTMVVKALEYPNLVLKVGLNTVVYDCCQLTSTTSMQNGLSRVLKDLECHALGYVYLSSQRNRLIHSCFFTSNGCFF